VLRVPTRGETIAVAGFELALEVLDDDDVLDGLIAEGADPDERNPYFGSVWRSSVVLGALLAGRRDVRGRRVLDLGCGPGLAGIVAGRLGADVTFADVMPEGLELAARNAAANDVRVSSFVELDLRTPPAPGSYQLVLAADLLYERGLAAALAPAIAGFLEPGAAARVADPYRPHADGFPASARAAGLAIRSLEGAAGVRVWEARR
jgi:predicted nicotinamide N-methyase